MNLQTQEYRTDMELELNQIRNDKFQLQNILNEKTDQLEITQKHCKGQYHAEKNSNNSKSSNQLTTNSMGFCINLMLLAISQIMKDFSLVLLTFNSNNLLFFYNLRK